MALIKVLDILEDNQFEKIEIIKKGERKEFLTGDLVQQASDFIGEEYLNQTHYFTVNPRKDDVLDITEFCGLSLKIILTNQK